MSPTLSDFIGAFDGHTIADQFVDSDNSIPVCPPLDQGAFAAPREHVHVDAVTNLQVKVGRRATTNDAGYRAKLTLEGCRESETRAVDFTPTTPIDE